MLEIYHWIDKFTLSDRIVTPVTNSGGEIIAMNGAMEAWGALSIEAMLQRIKDDLDWSLSIDTIDFVIVSWNCIIVTAGHIAVLIPRDRGAEFLEVDSAAWSVITHESRRWLVSLSFDRLIIDTEYGGFISVNLIPSHLLGMTVIDGEAGNFQLRAGYVGFEGDSSPVFFHVEVGSEYPHFERLGTPLGWTGKLPNVTSFHGLRICTILKRCWRRGT